MALIEWLRRDPRATAPAPLPGPAPRIEVAGRSLPIELKRHARAKRLTLRLAPDGEAVRITMPRWGRSAEALAFAEARRQWLAAQLAKVPPRRDPVASGKLLYRGRDIAIDWQSDSPRTPRIDGDTLRLGGPREGLEQRLIRWLEREALARFAEDGAHYCARAGQAVPDIRLSRARRRWGSCSSQGVLRLNWRLVQAPDAVRRSVVAHEVAHLVHFDHSPAFHALLGEIFDGDLDAANRWLARHGRTLYASFG